MGEGRDIPQITKWILWININIQKMQVSWVFDNTNVKNDGAQNIMWKTSITLYCSHAEGFDSNAATLFQSTVLL